MQHSEWVARYLAKFREECPGLPKNWEAGQREDDSKENSLREIIATYPDQPEQAAIEVLRRLGYVKDQQESSGSDSAH